MVSANTKDIYSNPALPSVQTAVYSMFQNILMGRVQKTQVNGYTQEVIVYEYIQGVLQISTGRNLDIQDVGQRRWRNKTLHCAIEVQLNLDDIIVFFDVRYRVLNKADWKQYGYQKFELTEDFTNQG